VSTSPTLRGFLVEGESQPPGVGAGACAQPLRVDGRGVEGPPDLSPVSRPSISGLASWYNGDGHLMANGKPFDPNAMTAAMLKVPLGTAVTACLAEDRSRCIGVTVTDRGPYVAGRVIDLTRAAFEALVGSTARGLVKVTVTLP
jgi:rare lipoprotein A